MIIESVFKSKLRDILHQLTSDQQEELFEKLYEKPEFQPPGYPYDYKDKDFKELTEEEIKYLYQSFVTIVWSTNPKLQGEDIRDVIY